MKKYLKTIIYLAGFIILFILAIICYKYLTNNYLPEEINLDNEQSNSNKANDFEVLNIKGEKVKLSDFFGKPIVVNFWATWCMPCQMELPEFEEIYKNDNQEIEVLMVNLTDGYTDTVGSVKKFVEDNGYEFPLYFDTKSSATDAYNLYSIPQTLFINKEGDIVKNHIGMINKQTLEKYIEEIKKEL